MDQALLQSQPNALLDALNTTDRAETLVLKGQLALLKGDLHTGLKCFDEAIRVNATSANLYYKQAISLFDYGSQPGHEKALMLASKKLKFATLLKGDHLEAWQAWGSVLLALGAVHGEQHYYQEAIEKIQRALSLSENTLSKDQLSDLHWDLGFAYGRLAEFSGEALDQHLAIEAYQVAQMHQEQLPTEFWSDFGHTCYQFAKQINDLRFFVKAIHCLKHALTLDVASHENWHLLGQVFQTLYAHTHDEDHYTQAMECYSSATKLQPQDSQLWFEWARSFLDSARRTADLKRLRQCIEKCQRALSLDPENPLAQAVLAEALAMLGDSTERVDLIYDAQNKISELVNNNSDCPEIFYSYGICLSALGHYFEEADYYHQAIEQFQTGLSIDRTCHQHWHAIALLYTLLGDLESDAENTERSLKFYQKALDLHPATFYLFDYAVALSKLGEMKHDQSYLEEAVRQFERLFTLQRNAIYLHPDWLYHYACTLDSLGDYNEEESYYLRSIEIFTHVLMIDPDFHAVHHRIALALSHLGDLIGDREQFFRSIHHYRLALKNDEENDAVILDWGVTLTNLAEHTSDTLEREQFYRDAELKLLTALKLGNRTAYYHLSCLFSLLGNVERAMLFLEKAARAEAVPPLDEILQDEWLENLRASSDFVEFLAHIERRRNYQEEC